MALRLPNQSLFFFARVGRKKSEAVSPLLNNSRLKAAIDTCGDSHIANSRTNKRIKGDRAPPYSSGRCGLTPFLIIASGPSMQFTATSSELMGAP